MEEIVLRCALGREFLYRPHVARELLQRFGSANEIYEVAMNECEEIGFGDDVLHETVGKIRQAFSQEGMMWAQEEVKWCRSKGIKLIFYGEPDYPVLLGEVYDAPFMLYYKGTADMNNPRSISIVGTRLASMYGKEACNMVVEHLAEYTPMVVSGLAYGIDIAAHKAALKNGLPTIAVLPNGLDMVYPARHRDIAVEIIRKGGGLLTEFPRGCSPHKMNFVKRNRIVAAISQALVVVESRVKGGAMITVEYANGYNREIFALPGRVSDVNSFGCNYLISKNVASIYSSAATIPAALGWDTCRFAETEYQPQLFSFDIENKEKILLTLKFDKPMGVEEISRATGLEWGILSSLLLEMEVEGKVVSVGNSDYFRKR